MTTTGERRAAIEIEGEHHRVPIGGSRFVHAVIGGTDGPTVVLLHGIPTNHRLWADVTPALATRARYIAIDLLGYVTGLTRSPRDLTPVRSPVHTRAARRLISNM